MNRLFPAQRRAVTFDSLVEGGRKHAVDHPTEDLLELVGALRSVPGAQPRPEFVADLRERLMVAAETELVPAPARERDDVARLTIKPRRTRSERRVGIALGAVAIIGATTSMAVASQSAIPGDTLYPLKRAIENTEAGFSVGDDAKGETILGNASGRLEEVDKLTRRSEPDAKLVTQTLNTFSDQAAQAGDLLMADYEQNGDEESVQQLHEFNDQSLETLVTLTTVVPEAAHDALVDAAQTVFTLDAAAQQVCPTDCGAGITELPPQLLAGGAQALTDAAQALAGGLLPGTAPSAGAQQGAPDNGVKDGNPSGLNPPETPIQLPTETTETGGGTSGEAGGATGDGNGGGSSDAGSDNGDGDNGGTGGKNKPKPPPIDLTPVTDTVTQVVTGVVDGVNQVLSGLTGGGQ
jgi:hypothetical protein